MRATANQPTTRMPPGYCMFVCDKCGCHSRWYAPIEQAHPQLCAAIKGLGNVTIEFDHWQHQLGQSRCSACAQTLPYSRHSTEKKGQRG